MTKEPVKQAYWGGAVVALVLGQGGMRGRRRHLGLEWGRGMRRRTIASSVLLIRSCTKP